MLLCILSFSFHSETDYGIERNTFPISSQKNLLLLLYLQYVFGQTDRQASAKCIDPDEMSQNVASHQGLHCLPLIQQFLDTTLGSKLYLFKF